MTEELKEKGNYSFLKGMPLVLSTGMSLNSLMYLSDNVDYEITVLFFSTMYLLIYVYIVCASLICQTLKWRTVWNFIYSVLVRTQFVTNNGWKQKNLFPIILLQIRK